MSRELISYYLQGTAISLTAFAFYLEFSPKIGGIFRRPDVNGKTSFDPLGIVPFLKCPFQDRIFWYPSNWDLNFIVFSQLGALTYTALRHELSS